MDSNHDIVPTLRMMDGVYTRLAADEIERLRARVAFLECRVDTSLITGTAPTHRCKVCGAWWRKWNVDGKLSWNLCSPGCGECCDNVAMGDQIEALVPNAKVGTVAQVKPKEQAEINAAPDRDDELACSSCGLTMAQSRALAAAKVGGDEREALTADEVSFVLDVYRYPGAKLALDAEIAAWRRPEKLGLVTCVGSYKWRPTNRLDAILCAALSSDGGEDKRDAERWRAFDKALRYGVRGAGHGIRIKVVEISPMFGDEKEICDVEGLVDAAIAANQAKGDA